MAADSLLNNWVELNKSIYKLDEKNLLKLLKTEVKGKRRVQVVQRLYGRFNRLRSRNERDQLLQGAWPW